jgi:hypothetical protein
VLKLKQTDQNLQARVTRGHAYYTTSLKHSYVAFIYEFLVLADQKGSIDQISVEGENFAALSFEMFPSFFFINVYLMNMNLPKL